MAELEHEDHMPDAMRGYSPNGVAELRKQFQKLRAETEVTKLDLAHLAGQLTNPRARMFANQGAGRRLPIVARCAVNMYTVFPPNRPELLSRDECEDVAIQFQAFGVNLYALFDNIAWICMLEGGGNLDKMQVGLFKTKCAQFIPPKLRTYLEDESISNWFQSYGKLYRDGTAHRIAPYLPPKVLTPEETSRWNDLHQQSMSALLTVRTAPRHARMARLEEHERLEVEKHQLGSNSYFVAVSLEGEDAAPLVQLHPQVLCDWAMSHELVRTFTAAMRAARAWPAPTIPSLTVGTPAPF